MNETEAKNPPIAVYPFLNFKVIKKWFSDFILDCAIGLCLKFSII